MNSTRKTPEADIQQNLLQEKELDTSGSVEGSETDDIHQALQRAQALLQENDPNTSGFCQSSETDDIHKTDQRSEILPREKELNTSGGSFRLDPGSVRMGLSSRRHGPVHILPHLCVGDYSDANSVGMLTGMGVTHALNCAGAERNFFSQFPRSCRNNNPIIHRQFDADDTETYDISRHFRFAIEYIEQVRKAKGKVLVYCKKGRNRSATVCVAYLISQGKVNFLEAVRTVRDKRGRKILTNSGFLRQLAVFAKQHELL